MPRAKRMRNLLKTTNVTPEVHQITTSSDLSVGNQLQYDHSQEARQQTSQHLPQETSEQTGQQRSQQIGQQTSHQIGQQTNEYIGQETSLQTGQQTTEQSGQQTTEQTGQQTSVPISESETERVQPKPGRHSTRYWLVDAIGKKCIILV